MEESREKYWPAIMRGSEDVDVASRRESLEVDGRCASRISRRLKMRERIERAG